MKKFYLTTAIPYVNGVPHIGHSLEYFQADTIRRYHQLLGEDTLLLSGADENALKNVQAAEKEGLPVRKYLDKYSKIWRDTYEALGVHLDVFQRGSDQKKHWPGVQKLWQLCQDSRDIYKKTYSGLYCVGCESFKTPSELVGGLCPDHQIKPELVEEENYFFKLSRYQSSLTAIIESGQLRITPENKKAEALSFIKSGLEDFSVSRTKERAKGVGVPVPGNPDQIIYVWFDALAIYITGIGFGADYAKFKKYWPADLHIIGKDINRFHSVYWAAMLLSAKLPLPKQILIHSFVNIDSQKISKSIGNVIDPVEFSKKHGLEPLRYFLLSQIPLADDGDFTLKRFKEVYNSDLANGLGNLVSRVAKLCEQNNIQALTRKLQISNDVSNYIEEFKFNEALALIWSKISDLDRRINHDKPWELADQGAEATLKTYISLIQQITTDLQPFLPETSEKISTQFSGQIKSAPLLFPRLY